ncbi:MAG TPA: alpha/beta hydrolase [Chloroflexia bacterium]|nr:alpha/beta hydrolase [Chloroflexia bacterium]
MTTQQPAAPGQYIRANDLDIYYEEQGAGPPLLLIHGGALAGASWAPYLAGFAAHYRVIMPDSRGHGRTGNPGGRLTYGGMADDVAALIGALGLYKPLIYGYSDGGQIAVEIGMRYPDLAGALVIGGAYIEVPEESLAMLGTLFGDPALPDVDFARFEQEHAGWVADLKETHGVDRWQALMSEVKPLWTGRLNYTPDDFARIVAPTLVLMADRDGLVPVEGAVAMFRLIAGAELAVLPASQHGDLIFSAAKVALLQPIILDFLARHRTP